MKTRLILKPGQRGTKRLSDKYGDNLVCVRFRYDAATRQRIKTVELIVERIDWNPPPEKFSADTLVAVKIEGYEIDHRKKIKEAGGKWNPDKRLWYVRYGAIAGTELEKHIYVDTTG
ncbi:hypothetical protein GeomeDRAFT_3197 [Geobacter metallireducens RCH3]|uniref:Uncharacterized protein n=1 Tax=Geobacter metallireducens (strain ATCC 53774 / DSM 7210 / GS-15) TaxID=269799 RepID=Q39TV6_GEOMG|nr:hypothetical protein [Geobacter metallireducens]ABB32318.1 hypothetical protein Gmet_2089 [Geobacter metallireducens GS-15]EHP84192.1 hypothetical protein GeomeDRAFT_3197 [Geobacter metallireducens RCH3]